MNVSEIKTQIKARLKLEELVRSRGVDLKRKGKSYVACCPFHQEKTPSFNVSPQGFYKCFGCGKGGDHFTFIMEIDRLTFPQALERLAELAKVELPAQANIALKDPLGSLKKSLENLNARLVNVFVYFYEKEEGRVAKEYLLNRAIDGGVIKKFSLGYLPWKGHELKTFLLSKAYSLDLLTRSGLFSSGTLYPLMARRLVFPIREINGRVVGFGGRSLDESQPKYLNSRDDPLFKKKDILYGFYEAQQHIRKDAKVILCEGYIDVLAWHTAGIELAVAPLGTSFTYEQASLLKRFVSKVLFCFDADKAGIHATLKSYLLVESLQIDSEVILMPSGKDPADVLQLNGREALRDLYEKHTVETFEYLLNGLSSLNSERRLGSTALVLELFKLVETNNQETQRDKKLKLMAKKLGSSVESLKKDFSTWLDTGLLERRSQKELMAYYQTGILPSHERLLIKGLIKHPYLFTWVRRYLLAEDLKEESMKIFYSLIEKIWEKKNEHLGVNDIFEELEADSQLSKFFLDAVVDNAVPMSGLDLKQTTCTIYGALLEKKRLALYESIKGLENKEGSSCSLMGTLNYLNQRIKQFNEDKKEYFSCKENLGD